MRQIAPVLLAHKVASEKSIGDFNYDSTLEWKYMKKLKSETQVRAWHIKVAGVDYNITQVIKPREGEMIAGYKATKSGRILDWKPLFEKPGVNHLVGIEYLLRYLEGQDISKLDLNDDDRYKV